MNKKPDVYSQVTNKIIADLERGNLTWLQPWQVAHAAEEISRSLRATDDELRDMKAQFEQNFCWASLFLKLLPLEHLARPLGA